MKKKYGFNRERTIKYSTQKRVQNNFDSGKSVGKSVALRAAFTIHFFKEVIMFIRKECQNPILRPRHHLFTEK